MRGRTRIYSALSIALVVAIATYAQSAPRDPGPHVPSQDLKNPIAASEASLRRGNQVYRQFCITCHTADGTGESDVTAEMPIKPSNFTNGEWKYGSTDGEIFSIIQGGTKTGMQPFAAMVNETNTWHLVNYIRTFTKEDETAAPVKPDVPENPIAYGDESLRTGRQLYARFCITCHGQDGTGDTAMLDFLSTHPSNLTDGKWNYGDRDGDIFLVIKNGTRYDMEAFNGRLSDERIWHVVNYLRSMGPKTD